MTKRTKTKDGIFVCRKCGHHIFIDIIAGWMKKLAKTDCPNCGEEPELNWIFDAEGDWQKDKKNFRVINL